MSTIFIEPSIIAAADNAALEADRDWEAFMDELEAEREAYREAERHAELGMMHGINFVHEEEDEYGNSSFFDNWARQLHDTPQPRLDYAELPEDPDALARFTAQ